MAEPRFWIIENPHADEPNLPEPASARGGTGPFLVPIVDENHGGVIAWANTVEQADRIVAALDGDTMAAAHDAIGSAIKLIDSTIAGVDTLRPGAITGKLSAAVGYLIIASTAVE